VDFKVIVLDGTRLVLSVEMCRDVCCRHGNKLHVPCNAEEFLKGRGSANF
jgi:hypothetical protein